MKKYFKDFIICILSLYFLISMYFFFFIYPAEVERINNNAKISLEIMEKIMEDYSIRDKPPKKDESDTGMLPPMRY